MPKLGDVFPDFPCATTEGDYSFHEYLERGHGWTILFSHPRDFTPVCTTELGKCADLKGEFEKRGVKMIALSCDPVESHRNWSKDITPSGDIGFPIIADPRREICIKLGMLDPEELDQEGVPLPARALFIIGPGKKLRLSILYPATTGRNFDEVLRVIDSMMLTEYSKVATPVNWKAGERVVVVPGVKTEDARGMFENLEVLQKPSGKEYLRFVDCPEIKYGGLATVA